MGFFQKYHLVCNKQISGIVELVRGKLAGGARITLGALTVIDVHGMYCVNFSISMRVVFKYWIAVLKPEYKEYCINLIINFDVSPQLVMWSQV